MSARLPLRLRLTLTSAALLLVVLALVLGASWWLLDRHLGRTLPPQYADAVMGRLGTQYALAGLGAVLLVLGLGWVAAGSALAPLRRIADTARSVSEERLDVRVGMADGPDDEVREVAVALDAMLDRVAGAVAAQQRFVANASHELRTPLTVIRTGAEVVLDDPGATVEELRAVAREAVETTERTEELLDALLVLAAATRGARPTRLNAGSPPPRGGEPTFSDVVDLAGIAERAVEGARGEAAAAGVVLDARFGVAPVRGDAVLLERLAGNLVENAIRHGDGTVEVSAFPATAGGGARLRVGNGGAPVRPEELGRLTQPFERLQRAGGPRGSGLGLSIVQAVAEAHGGTLHLSAPAAGGLVAEVALPARD